jgi:hypothetical protein
MPGGLEIVEGKLHARAGRTSRKLIPNSAIGFILTTLETHLQILIVPIFP